MGGPRLGLPSPEAIVVPLGNFSQGKSAFIISLTCLLAYFLRIWLMSAWLKAKEMAPCSLYPCYTTPFLSFLETCCHRIVCSPPQPAHSRAVHLLELLHPRFSKSLNSLLPQITVQPSIFPAQLIPGITEQIYTNV